MSASMDASLTRIKVSFNGSFHKVYAKDGLLKKSYLEECFSVSGTLSFQKDGITNYPYCDGDLIFLEVGIDEYDYVAKGINNCK